MLLIEKAKTLVTQTAESAANLILPYDALHSYNNPRLENSAETYLDSDHIAELLKNSEITKIERIGDPEIIDGVGKIERFGFTTKLGYSYCGIIGTPETKKTDIATIGTSPWHTSDRGHNEHTVRNFMREGNPVFFVGAEGSWHENADPEGPITLADSASAVLQFANIAELYFNRRETKIQQGERNLIGESRGAMVGMGILALAEYFSQHIKFADLTAPCFPDKLTIRAALSLIDQLINEPREITRLGGRLANRTLIHYPSTIDLVPSAQKHQLAIGFALSSGEAGALAKHVPKDTLMHVSVFEKDRASMASRWLEIFPEDLFPNIRITSLEGSHLTIADPETLMYLLIRSSLAAQNTNSDHPLTQKSVFDEAHAVVTMLEEYKTQKAVKSQKLGNIAVAA